MSTSYERPFRPIDLVEQASALFPLDEMIASLRGEEVYDNSNRNAFTLVHDECLTAVLTVVKEGAECGDHSTPQPAIIVSLEGRLTIKGAAGTGTIHLPEGGAAVLAPNVEHKLVADTGCAYLTIIGSRSH